MFCFSKFLLVFSFLLAAFRCFQISFMGILLHLGISEYSVHAMAMIPLFGGDHVRLDIKKLEMPKFTYKKKIKNYNQIRYSLHRK